MALHREIDGSRLPTGPEPVVRLAGPRHRRRDEASWRLAIGTLACPACDAPVAPASGPMSPADAIGCGFCEHAAAVRDFLSLAAPARPARVEVRVIAHARA